jgi:hypothetical protein
MIYKSQTGEADFLGINAASYIKRRNFVQIFVWNNCQRWPGTQTGAGSGTEIILKSELGWNWFHNTGTRLASLFREFENAPRKMLVTVFQPPFNYSRIFLFKIPVLRIRIRIHLIHVVLGLLDPDPDP